MTFVTPVRHWVCPNCTLTQITHEARPHSRFHSCPGLHDLTAPMVEAGVHVQVRAVEREDYIGNEVTGRYMAVVTERPDGSNDTAVMAPAARASASVGDI
jgi:hypothetical protein